MDDTALCTYCNQPATTRDHIPPKLLFPRPRPNNLATVPACESCNRSFSNDDEYARLALMNHIGAGDHPDLGDNLDWLQRALTRPQAAGLRKSFLKHFEDAGVFKKGKGRPKDPKIQFDLPRISRVVSRTAIALHRIHYSQRLIPEHGVFAAYLPGVFEHAPRLGEFGKYMMDSINQITATCQPLSWGNETVVFVFGRSEDEPEHSAWRFRFYGGAEFGAWVAPRWFLKNVKGAVYLPE